MINRRRFVGSLAYGVCTAASSRAAAPRIDGAIIQSQIEALSVFGRLPGGTFQDGVGRVGYSDADIAGRKYVMDLMRRAGASVRIDAAGNIFASRSGSDPSLKPVLFGSHIDSVPNGGNFDGDLGSLSAVAILQLLHDLNTTTRRPLTAVVWACEEASFSGVALRAARDGARAGVEVGSVWASRKDEADVNSFSPAVSRIVTDTSRSGGTVEHRRGVLSLQIFPRCGTWPPDRRPVRGVRSGAKERRMGFVP
jgi:N-carbamoyl-L-amino-acid hydrolase